MGLNLTPELDPYVDEILKIASEGNVVYTATCERLRDRHGYAIRFRFKFNANYVLLITVDNKKIISKNYFQYKKNGVLDSSLGEILPNMDRDSKEYILKNIDLF
jgi:uncharacterized protein (DUF1697 family)